jgi:aminobenzoyl-glutamate utilization protein B
MNVGWNFRREHLRLAQRSHYVIVNGGDQPNVVPPTASVWTTFARTITRACKAFGRSAIR